MDLDNPPERYWHCSVLFVGDKKEAVENDLTYDDLKRTIIDPWHEKRRFSVGGRIVDPAAPPASIKITHTAESKEVIAEQHNRRMRDSGIADMATDRRLLPLSRGRNLTNELLFMPAEGSPKIDEVALVLQICRRLAETARPLKHRRNGKLAFLIEDEYDAQDLLQAVLKGYFKYPVLEDPMPKVAGTRSSRADVSIEALGIVIELKYARSGGDQKRIFDDLIADLSLYAGWGSLKTLIFVIYGSNVLRDPEALEQLSGPREVNGKRFQVHVINV